MVDLPYVYGVDQNLLCDHVVELYLVLDQNLLCDFVVEELEDLLYVYDDKTFPLDQRKKNFSSFSQRRLRGLGGGLLGGGLLLRL